MSQPRAHRRTLDDAYSSRRYRTCICGGRGCFIRCAVATVTLTAPSQAYAQASPLPSPVSPGCLPAYGLCQLRAAGQLLGFQNVNVNLDAINTVQCTRLVRQATKHVPRRRETAAHGIAATAEFVCWISNSSQRTWDDCTSGSGTIPLGGCCVPWNWYGCTVPRLLLCCSLTRYDVYT